MNAPSLRVFDPEVIVQLSPQILVTNVTERIPTSISHGVGISLTRSDILISIVKLGSNDPYGPGRLLLADSNDMNHWFRTHSTLVNLRKMM
jgi:hypothetical protein